MIKLNLLPPQEKYLLDQERFRRMIVFYGVAIMGALLFLAAIMGAIWLYVDIQLRATNDEFNSSQASMSGTDLKTQQDAVTALNNELKKISLAQNNQKKYSSLLASLAGLVIDGVRLDTLSIGADGAVSIEGYAQKREQVISFHDALEKSGLFANVDNPLSNLVKETDINFSFSCKISPTASNK
jgi:Tfp pilus assembly protein PilN